MRTVCSVDANLDPDLDLDLTMSLTISLSVNLDPSGGFSRALARMCRALDAELSRPLAAQPAKPNRALDRARIPHANGGASSSLSSRLIRLARCGCGCGSGADVLCAQQ